MEFELYKMEYVLRFLGFISVDRSEERFRESIVLVTTQKLKMYFSLVQIIWN